MSKETLLLHIEKRLSIREIAVKEKTSFTNVRYWLRKHGLKTRCIRRAEPLDPNNKYKCQCGESEQENFYGNKTRTCKRCHNQHVINLGKQKRILIIEFLGGKCSNCGYSRFYGALDVHHNDPQTKDVSWKSSRNWSWKRIKKEIEGCVLLCRNCHAELHGGFRM